MATTGILVQAFKARQQTWSTFRRELYAVQQAMRNFLPEFNGRHLKVFTDHKALLGAFKQPTSQAYDPIAEKHINEITQWTSDIRFIDGESNTLADWLLGRVNFFRFQK